MYPLRKLLIKQPKTPENSSLFSRNIFLVGFMGSGKSSTGRALSKLINYSFVDIDDVIIRNSDKKSINEIFEEHGEGVFREIEKAALLQTIKSRNQVIATGGGTLIYNPPSSLKSEKLMDPNDLIILLDATFETCIDRCKNSDRRPLFRDLEKAKNLYDSRLPIYYQISDVQVKIDGITSQQVAKKIKDILQNT